MASVAAPGPVASGAPQMSPETDPRTHPQLLEAMKPYNLHASSIPDPATLPALDSFEAIDGWVGATDDAMNGMYGMIDYSDVPALNSSKVQTTKSEEFVVTPDGHKVKLIIYRPAGSSAATAPLPAVMYIHGGGMAILNTENYPHMSWIESLAKAGMIAMAVDYRNAYTKTGHNPFPTGLNDCAAAVQWVHAHRQQLGISKIIIQGESGGGNLTLATALKAKKEGWIDAIDGVCAFIPYISGAYNEPVEWKVQNLPSLVEFDGYFISTGMMSVLVKVYDPTGENAKNPLAWPYWATVEDVKGLPPHMIYINELDPLRDEGSAYYKKIAAAGGRVIAKMNLGAVHGGEWFLRNAVPDHFLSIVSEIKSFAERL